MVSVSIMVPMAVNLYETPLSFIILITLLTCSLTLSPLSVGNIENSRSTDIIIVSFPCSTYLNSIQIHDPSWPEFQFFHHNILQSQAVYVSSNLQYPISRCYCDRQ